MRLKFGTDGWFDLMAERFTYGNLRFVVQAVVRYLKTSNNSSKGIVVGYDTRFQSDMFAKTIVEVLAGADIKSYLMENDTPSPVVSMAVREKGCGGGLIVTGSHYGPYYNGLRFLTEDGAPASEEITIEIEENMSMSAPDEKIFTIPFEKAEDGDLVEYININDIYFSKIRKIIDFETIKNGNLSVIYDPLYGSGRNYLDYLLAQNGVNVKVLHNYRDTLFGGMVPDVSENSLKQLIREVKNSSASVGLALDCDGDRFGVVDSLGNYINQNEVVSMILLHLIKRRKFSGKVVRSVATTHLLDRICKKYDIELIEVPVGFKYVSKHMLKDDIILGVDESGSLSIIGHIPEKDGILANLLVAEIVAIENKPLTTIVSNIMDEFGELHSSYITRKFENDKKRESFIEKLKGEPPVYVAGLKVVDIYDIDGIKYILNDGSWMLVRNSDNESSLDIYVEGTGRDVLRRLERFVDEMFK